jgi:hypothetical protein
MYWTPRPVSNVGHSFLSTHMLTEDAGTGKESKSIFTFLFTHRQKRYVG